MADCRSVKRLLQRVPAGAPVDDDQLREALEHVDGCASCRDLFDLAWRAAFPEERTSTSDVSEMRVDTNALFERAYTAMMADRETNTRIRAAEQLGGLERLGAAALEALAEAAEGDSSDEVRAAALGALERQNDNLLKGDFEKPRPIGPIAEFPVVIQVPVEEGVGAPAGEPAEEPSPVSDSLKALSKKLFVKPESPNSD